MEPGDKVEYPISSGHVKATIKKIWTFKGITFYSFEENKDSINSVICKPVVESTITEEVEKTILGENVVKEDDSKLAEESPNT